VNYCAATQEKGVRVTREWTHVESQPNPEPRPKGTVEKLVLKLVSIFVTNLCRFEHKKNHVSDQFTKEPNQAYWKSGNEQEKTGGNPEE
jgi:hypothetical protein